jgi:hypothetical protein
MPTQSAAAVVASFRDVIAGCALPLTTSGEIDQRALAAARWSVTSRKTRLDLEDKVLPLDAHPTLRLGEYEATDWQHAGHVESMQLIRGDLLSGSQSFDHCRLNARLTNATTDLNAVVAGIVAHFGRSADRTGAIPRGGDFLTPRSDPQMTGHYWQLPTHDVYLEISPDGFAVIDVVAMPNREKLDQYSPDRPERRLVTVPAEKR